MSGQIGWPELLWKLDVSGIEGEISQRNSIQVGLLKKIVMNCTLLPAYNMLLSVDAKGWKCSTTYCNKKANLHWCKQDPKESTNTSKEV